MFVQFKKYLTGFASFSEEQFDQILSHAKHKRLRKRQFLLQEGDVCQQTAWVGKGCLRLFLTDRGGKDHVIDFGLENHFITDRLGLFHKTPSLYNIDALEDAEVLLFSLESIVALVEQLPNFAKAVTSISMQNLASYQSRITATLTLSADEKYNALFRQNPDLVQRLPQHMIASYLGITPATLSRVRKKFEND
jgi:CRP-like cAMP-binding protein